MKYSKLNSVVVSDNLEPAAEYAFGAFAAFMGFNEFNSRPLI